MKSGLSRPSVCSAGLFLWVVTIFATAGAGCVSPVQPKLKDDVAALKTQVWALNKRMAEIGQQASRNENEIILLLENLNKGGGEKLDAERNMPLTRVDPRLNGNESKKVRPPGDIYQSAKEALEEGNHERAVEESDALIEAYPMHLLAPQAQYLKGEAFFAQGRYKRAQREYGALLTRWPESSEEPGAMLKLGICMTAVGKKEDGKKMLDKLIGKYPQSEAAEDAKKQLARMTGRE